jgi:hypothetical protein
MGKLTDPLGILNGKREGKTPLDMPSHRWKDTIKIDLKGKGRDIAGLIHVTVVVNK